MAQVALGEFLRKAGRIDEAFKVLERAAEMVPMATGPRSPRSMMAQMALERKDSARAISELEKLLEHENTDLPSVRLLARELEATQAPAPRLMSAYERIAQLDPFDASNHSKLGRLKMQAGDPRSAVGRYGHYFLGSVIISQKDGQNFIVDGQQRLTTLTLLLTYLPIPLPAAVIYATLGTAGMRWRKFFAWDLVFAAIIGYLVLPGIVRAMTGSGCV